MAEPRRSVDKEWSLIERECKELEKELQELKCKLQINAEERSKLKKQYDSVKQKLHQKKTERESTQTKERTRSARVSDISFRLTLVIFLLLL